MALTKDTKPTTTVDPDTTGFTNCDDAPSQVDIGAKNPIDHPLTQSTVDANYSDDSSGAPADGARRSRKSNDESSETAGVEGPIGGKYTDSADEKGGGD